MKAENIIWGVLILFIFGCGGNLESGKSEVEKAIETTIENLNTNDEKKKFLEKIFEDDQSVRDGSIESGLMLEYGVDSEEHWEFIHAQWRQDYINLIKVEKYLEKFGYPVKKELGIDAAIAPWLVVHHTGDVGIRNAYFEVL